MLACVCVESEIFVDNLLVRVHLIIEMRVCMYLSEEQARPASLPSPSWYQKEFAPWEFEFPFPSSLISTFLEVDISGTHGTTKGPSWGYS